MTLFTNNYFVFMYNYFWFYFFYSISKITKYFNEPHKIYRSNHNSQFLTSINKNDVIKPRMYWNINAPLDQMA